MVTHGYTKDFFCIITYSWKYSCRTCGHFDYPFHQLGSKTVVLALVYIPRPVCSAIFGVVKPLLLCAIFTCNIDNNLTHTSV